MDEKKKTVLKRIFAWIFLALFVLVILNLMIFQLYKDIFLFAYIALIIVYFMVFKNTPSTKQIPNKSEKDNENTSIENEEK